MLLVLLALSLLVAGAAPSSAAHCATPDVQKFVDSPAVLFSNTLMITHNLSASALRVTASYGPEDGNITVVVTKSTTPAVFLSGIRVLWNFGLSQLNIVRPAPPKLSAQERPR
jgi:hypothetical protein